MGIDIASESQCEEFRDDRKIILVEENGRKFIGQNNYRKLFVKFRIDGCLIRDGKKCDYLLINICEKKAYFIELKGQDLVVAIEQIGTSIDYFIDRLDGYIVNARVILTKVKTPDILDTRLIKLQKRMKSLRGTFEKGVNVYQESV